VLKIVLSHFLMSDVYLLLMVRFDDVTFRSYRYVIFSTEVLTDKTHSCHFVDDATNIDVA
jgi:hypothetical protein